MDTTLVPSQFRDPTVNQPAPEPEFGPGVLLRPPGVTKGHYRPAPRGRSPKWDGPRRQVPDPDQTKAGANIVVTIELYGVPRLRAGTGRLSLDAATLSEALDGLARACPTLDGAVVSHGRALPAYRVSLNGDRFVSDPETALAAGDVLIVLSADVGG